MVWVKEEVSPASRAMAAGAAAYSSTDITAPRASIMRKLVRNPSRTRRSSPAPVFWAVKTETAWAPLSPKELAKPSMRVVAV